MTHTLCGHKHQQLGGEVLIVPELTTQELTIDLIKHTEMHCLTQRDPSVPHWDEHAPGIGPG